MASIQCIKCKAGIHYHGEPEGIEYIFIKKKDWNKIISTRFDSRNKQYINGSSSPALYQTDTIESDFKESIMKAWKCPKCGAFIFFDEHKYVKRIYEEDNRIKYAERPDICEYVVFDDYSWDTITESAIPNRKISKLFNPLIYANLTDSKLILIWKDSGVTKTYKRFTIPSD